MWECCNISPDLLQNLISIYLVRNILKCTSFSSLFIPIITIFDDVLHSDDTNSMHHPRLLHAAYPLPLSWCWLPLQNIGQAWLLCFPIPTWRCMSNDVISVANRPPVSRTLLSRVAALIALLAEGRAPVATVTQAEESSGVRISVVASRPLCSPPVTR